MELSDAQVNGVTELVAEAGRHALAWFRPSSRATVEIGQSGGRQPSGGQLTIDNKLAGTGGFDPVTEADREVERRIRDVLAQMFPEDSITGEEFGTTGSGAREWFIDPVDGTRAFVSGQPMWGTLVGLVSSGVPVAGWMYLPVLDEIYVGFPGRATLTSAKSGLEGGPNVRETVSIATRPTFELADAVLLCTHPSMFAPGLQQDRFTELADTVKMTRFGGDCMNYGLLASGDADLVVENQLAPYDIIPLIPIITEAGGVITDLQGSVPVGGGYVVAAANSALHSAALGILNR